MQRSDRGLLTGLGVIIGVAAIVALIVSDSLAIPDEKSGWVYHYQGLIGGVLALLGAVLTVVHLAREQRNQAIRFERQMNLLVRKEQRLISRQTLLIIPTLYSLESEVRSWVRSEHKKKGGRTSPFDELSRITSDAQQLAMNAPRGEWADLLDETFIACLVAIEGRAQLVRLFVPDNNLRRSNRGVPTNSQLEMVSQLGFALADARQYLETLRAEYQLSPYPERANEWTLVHWMRRPRSRAL